MNPTDAPSQPSPGSINHVASASPGANGNALSEAERRKLLMEWNATETELLKASCIHELIEQQARETPDATALVCRDTQLTWSELNARANQVASYLCKLGVGPEMLVGICVERSLEMVIGLLGILKSGGAYLPLDPAYPAERLAFMIQDARVQVLLTQDHLMSALPAGGTRAVRLDTDLPLIAAEPTDNQPRGVSPTHLAYVIYTSGSTGKPKGVMVEHGNVLNFFTAMDARVPRSPDCTWLAVTSPSFDISVLELFWTLARGVKVVLYAGDDRLPIKNSSGTSDSPSASNETRNSNLEISGDHSIPALIQKYAVTHLQCTASMASMLLLDERARKVLGRLQALLIGGEPFPGKLARQLRGIVKGAIHNMYGPTETTVWSTTWQLPPDAAPNRIPVGRPIANTQIYIVDAAMQPVPVGVEGELLIGGAGVARGYLGRDQLTAERFIPNPFIARSTQSPARPALLYRTGDLARYLPDGNIELLGRMDNQVKIRGHRVELGEIEALLNEHPGVRESVVLLKEITPGEKILVAYLISRDGQKPAREHVRQYAQEKLPEYMVPGLVMFMTAFPQTPNKKIDRNTFPAPEADARETEADLERPKTEIEDALAVLWKEVLGVKQVSRSDNFFDSGGHSMRAMQLVVRVQKRFQVDLPLRNIFERQTFAGIAETIEALAWSNWVKAPRAGQREIVDV
jgi:non-ribosomal peptide synthetase component F/acyl carrier protein